MQKIILLFRFDDKLRTHPNRKIMLTSCSRNIGICWLNPKRFSIIIIFVCDQFRSIPFGGVLQRGGVGVFSPNTFSSLTSGGTWGDLRGLNSGVNPRVTLRSQEFFVSSDLNLQEFVCACQKICVYQKITIFSRFL